MKLLRAFAGVVFSGVLLVGAICVVFLGLMAILAATVLLMHVWKPLAAVFGLGATCWWGWQCLQFLETMGVDEDSSTRRW